MTPTVRRRQGTELMLDVAAVVLLVIIIVAGMVTYVSETHTRAEQTTVILERLEEIAEKNAARFQSIETVLSEGGCQVEPTL